MEPTGEIPAADIVLPASSGPAPSRWRGRWWIPVALVGLLGSVLLLLIANDGDDEQHSLQPATTVDATEVPATTLAPTTSDDAPTNSEAVVGTSSDVSIESSTSSTQAQAHAGTSPTATTIDQLTSVDDVHGEYTPGSNCTRLDVTVSLSDPQGIRSAAVGLDYPSVVPGANRTDAAMRLVSGSAERGQWTAQIAIANPPFLNFNVMPSTVDRAGNTSGELGMLPLVPKCAESTTVESWHLVDAPGSPCAADLTVGLSDPRGVASAWIWWSASTAGGLEPLRRTSGSAGRGDWVARLDISGPHHGEVQLQVVTIDGAGGPSGALGFTTMALPTCGTAQPTTTVSATEPGSSTTSPSTTESATTTTGPLP